jgi:hypothetical protein
MQRKSNSAQRARLCNFFRTLLLPTPWIGARMLLMEWAMPKRKPKPKKRIVVVPRKPNLALYFPGIAKR